MQTISAFVPTSRASILPPIAPILPPISVPVPVPVQVPLVQTPPWWLYDGGYIDYPSSCNHYFHKKCAKFSKLKLKCPACGNREPFESNLKNFELWSLSQINMLNPIWCAYSGNSVDVRSLSGITTRFRCPSHRSPLERQSYGSSLNSEVGPPYCSS